MIAWKIECSTPECYPERREFMVIANDITHMIGSFATEEDLLFKVGLYKNEVIIVA